jgi:hypothetical protein
VIFKWQIFAILQKKREKRIYCHKFPFFGGKQSAKKKKKKRIKKILRKSPQLLVRVLENFLLSYFDYRQIWLNTLMDDRHLSNLSQT